MAEYRNPQQEGGGGDKRMLMVFAVTFALIIISQIFLFKKNPAAPAKTAPAQATQSQSSFVGERLGTRSCPDFKSGERHRSQSRGSV